MIICDFCAQYTQNSECSLGLRIPKAMSCREFAANFMSFCSKPGDFAGSGQIVQMATFFGMKGTELKKVKLMAARAEALRR